MSDVSSPLAERLLKVLPQTQCTRCGYPDCAGYAQAIADGEALINQCPPGGAEGIRRLAAITGGDELPLNPINGFEGPRSIAWIDEAWCIGCTLCIKACPVDCIVGGNKRMHTIIESQCTGCELCVPACPVDCIVLENVTEQRTGWDAWTAEEADTARTRYELTTARRKRAADTHAAVLEKKAEHKLAHLPELAKGATGAELERKRSVIEAALARAREKRQSAE
ncbi:electron transport complex subunit RsxB [Ottowia thiooxydans]|uniref:electron transport complex subunit RsxB n=1 Tax=Ottowia thiooxydans TaxID=219182 RepID=UPI0004004799|nr:electron transport complex subunit RsxB [Ottowia thiooxydans]